MIGVISDTHGCKDTVVDLVNHYFKNAELILHAGDVLYHGPRNPIPDDYNPKELAAYLNELAIPIVACAGNCDAEVDGMVLEIPIQNPYALVIYNKIKILITHGHHLTFEDKLKIAKRFKVNILVSGHTHIPELIKRDDIIFLNPGSPGLSKHSQGISTAARIMGSRVEVFDIVSGNIIMSDMIS